VAVHLNVPIEAIGSLCGSPFKCFV